MTDVYLSFADQDREQANGFGAELERRGLSWIGPPRLAGGEYDTGATRHAMENATWVVVLLTRHSSPSEWVRRDLDIAHQLGKRIAVLLGPGVPSHHLPAADRVFELRPVEEASRLAEAIARLAGRQAPATPQPPEPALSRLPAPLDGVSDGRLRGYLSEWPDGKRSGEARARLAELEQRERDNEFAKRVSADDMPTTAAAPVAEQAAADAEYTRRMAEEAVPVTAASASGNSREEVPSTVGARPASGDTHRSAHALNDLLSTGTLLSMTAGRKEAVRSRMQSQSTSRREEGVQLRETSLETPPGRASNSLEREAPHPTAPPAPMPHAAERSRGPLPAPAAPASAPPPQSSSRGSSFALLVGMLAVLGALGIGLLGGQELAGKLLATLKMKLNAFTFFGLFGRERKPVEPEADLVDCSVFAPPAAPPGETIMVQVFLHTAKQAERAQFMATVMDTAAALKGVQTLQTEIRRGARVTVTLAAKGLDIDEPQQIIVWRGEPVFAQFLVTLPEGCDAATFHSVVRIAVDGGLVGRIAFAIRADAKAAMPRSVAAGETARRYNHAFLSYASADRKEVLKRAQVLKAAGVSFFQDILSLDPGARWEKEIYKHIDGCDLFLLFWSKSARESEWVIREAEYALARQHDGEIPDIVPVILEGPPVVRPPDSLAAIHFNDQITYLIAQS